MLKSLPKLVTLCTLASLPVHAEVSPEYLQHQESLKISKAAQETVIYGYPLVMMNLLKNYYTYTNAPGDFRAPINQFASNKTQSTPLDSNASSNIDVLSSNAWLDLTNDAIVFHIPEIYKRFFLFEIFDGWTNVIKTIDTSTTDGKERNFTITGPNFKGTVPKNTTHIHSKTNIVCIKGITQCFGAADYENMYKIQNGYTLTPVASFGKPYSPPAIVQVSPISATKESAHDQVSAMNYTEFFNTFSSLLEQNPPLVQDVSISKNLIHLGLLKPLFDAENTNRATEDGLEDAFKNGKHKINTCYGSVVTKRNSWKMILRKENDFGTDYLRRALLARADLPTSLTQNLLTMTCDADSDGFRLNGLRPYRIHIKKEHLPPVNAFWSLTLYNANRSLNLNSENIYAIQSFSDVLHYNEDGSLDIYIQHDKPKHAKHNWLPCPKEGFELHLRLYQPQPQVIDGHWMAPSVLCQNPL
ncbi:MAG: DUF1214 domain-containing protein [Chlamydiales bacterium]|nr:DUF1214 domain-containing protein [Chlamydiales bacterium]